MSFINETVNYAVSIGVTTYYKSDPVKLKKLLYSLIVKQEEIEIDFDEPRIGNEKLIEFIIRMNHTEQFSKDDFITFSDPVEMIIIIDSYPEEEDNPENECELEHVKAVITEFSNKVKHLKLPIDIKVVIPTTNIKVSRARNYIIEHALSKYITFKDDDDLSVNINKILKHVLDWSIRSSTGRRESNTETTVKLFYTLSGSYNYRPPEIEKEKKEKIIPFISQLGIWSSIYDVEFLRRNNIYFVPDIGSEDIVFRAVLHHIIDKFEGKFEIIDEILYYYLDPSNRSFTFSLSPREEHDVKTILNGKLIKDFVNEQQQTSDRIIKKLFEFDKERFEITDYILFGISHAATFRSSLNIIRNSLTKHNNFLQTEMDRALFKLTKEIKVLTEESIFDTLEPEVQELALYLAPMYLTLSELDEIANHDLETLNLLYNRKLKLPNKKLSTKLLNPFMTRFLMLYSLITKTNSEFIDLDLAKKIYQTFCSNYSKQQFKNDFITFSKRIDELNTDNLNEVIKKHKLKDLYAEFIHFMKYDHINTLKNSNLHFRGMLNVFSFYVLTA